MVWSTGATLRAERRHRRDRQVDIAARVEVLAGQRDVDGALAERRRHQQRRDVLARQPAIDLDPARAEMSVALDHHRRAAGRRAGHDAERIERRDQRPDRPLAHRLVAIDDHDAIDQRRRGSQEARRGAGIAEHAAARSGGAGSRRCVTMKLVASGSSTTTPIWRSAAAISDVSLLLSAPVSRLVPFASAASSSARLVIDFEPGGVTRPTSGWSGGVRTRAAVMTAASSHAGRALSSYSTVTDFARLRGWSTSVPMNTAVW